MVDLKKPVVLVKDGKKYPARVVCTDRVAGRGEDLTVMALYDQGNGRGEGAAWFNSDGTWSNWRLENVPEKKSLFANLYPERIGKPGYLTRNDADRWKAPYRVAVLEYLYEDGKLVDVILHKDI